MAWGEGGAHGPLLLARHCAGIPEAGGLWRSGRPCRLSESPVFGKGLTGKLLGGRVEASKPNPDAGCRQRSQECSSLPG